MVRAYNIWTVFFTLNIRCNKYTTFRLSQRKVFCVTHWKTTKTFKIWHLGFFANVSIFHSYKNKNLKHKLTKGMTSCSGMKCFWAMSRTSATMSFTGRPSPSSSSKCIWRSRFASWQACTCKNQVKLKTPCWTVHCNQSNNKALLRNQQLTGEFLTQLVECPAEPYSYKSSDDQIQAVLNNETIYT